LDAGGQDLFGRSSLYDLALRWRRFPSKNRAMSSSKSRNNMPDKNIYSEVKGAIGHIVLNRPDKRNALTWDMWSSLGEMVDQLEADPAVKVIVVRGVNDVAFAAGADIVEFESVYSTKESSMAYTKAMQDSEAKLSRVTKPTIAMIQGPCIGAGCAIAMCCDMRFGDDTASFAVPPARLGLTYSLADTKRLVDVIGPSNAKDMMFTARVVKAGEAAQIGLVNRLFASDALREKTKQYAVTISSLSSFTNQATKKTVQAILDGAEDDTDDTRQLFMDAFQGLDFKEGRSAFMEKRKPKFS
jgi:enoyl-CoA hydratase